MSSPIRVTLAEEHTWAQFHPNTEMIVTKQRGRVIFPHLDYLVQGLDPQSLYTIKVHLERMDDVKYKFEEGEWKEAARGDPRLPVQHTEHKDGARSGAHWMAGPVSFASLKITNDPKNENKKLVLVQSMHKYRPVVTITRLGEQSGQEFRHHLTEFMVVTAYQREEITKLKVSLNKFAKGKHGKKRAASEDSDEGAGKRSSVSPMNWSPFHQNPIGFSGIQTPSSSSSSSSSNGSPTGPFPQNPLYPNFSGFQNPYSFPNFYMNPVAYSNPMWQQGFMDSGGAGISGNFNFHTGSRS